MKKSEILRVARGLIERKTKHTLCSALIGVVTLTPGCHKQAEELRQWIKGMLGDAYFYEAWMHKNYRPFALEHNIPYVTWVRDRDESRLFEAARPGRLQWMSWMIEFWEKEEAHEELNKSLRAIPYIPPNIKPPTLF